MSCLVLLSGCAGSIRQKLVGVLIDTQEPPPPTQRFRRDLLREIDELENRLEEEKNMVRLQREEEATAPERPIEKLSDWAQVAEQLPKDYGGHVDWVQALRSGVIAPRPSKDPFEPQLAEFPLDITLITPGKEAFGAGFPHSSHTAWLSCGSCHPGIFPLPRGQREPITMAKIRNGEFCGACHGKVSFGVDGRCARCHTAGIIPAREDWTPPEPAKPIEAAKSWEEAEALLPKKNDMPDWAAALTEGVIAPLPGIGPEAQDEPILDLDVERVPSEESGGEMLKVVFPHSTHTALLKCESCHPDPFEEKAGETPITMEKIHEGQYCGKCHGTVAYSRLSCNRCHTAMDEF